MTRFIVSLVGGASLGGTYALIGLGLVLVYRATETLNFAHGQLMLVPAFLVGRWQSRGTLSLIPGVVLSIVIIGTICALFYRLVLRQTVGLPHFMPVIATFGLAAILDGVVAIEFGSQEYNISISGLPTGVIVIFGARVSAATLTLAATTLVLAGAVAAFLRFTQTGTRIRAAGQDARLASQGGINVHRVFVGSWVLAGALAAVAGIAYGATNIVNPSMVALAFAAFPAILLGGLDSIEGALVGGVLIGILQGFTATYFGGEYLDVVTYVVLLGILLLLPQGLFGTRRVVRA